MLQTKFCGNRFAGSGDEAFRRFFFTKYGHSGHLGHVTNMIFININFHVPKSLHTKFG